MKDRQRQFVEEYLIDLNATQAAIRAGYSKKSAAYIGMENLRKPHIAAAIQAEMDKRSAKAELTAAYVLESIQEVAERCMQRVPVMVGQGENRTQLVDEEGNHVWAFDASGANKSLELLGKHLKLFTDKVQHEGTMIINVSPEDARL